MNVRHDFTPCDAPPTRDTRAPRRAFGAGRLRSALFTGGTLAVLWTGLHWQDPASWVIGFPTVLMGGATALLFPASPPPRLSPLGTLRFALFALRGIAVGAVDVTRRSLRPARLDSRCLTLRTRLPAGRPRRLFAIAITLLPGTLTARLDGDSLIVHALDAGPATRAEIKALEVRVAALFSLDSTEDNA